MNRSEAAVRRVVVTLLPIMVVASAVLWGEQGDSTRRVTSPGSNMVITVPSGWEFRTSAEQRRDSMNDIATLTGTLFTPDTSIVLFVERMNQTYPSSMLADRIRAVGIRTYCIGVVDSILSGSWIFHDFASEPSFQETPLEFHFAARVTVPSGDASADSVRIMEFFYRKVGGIEVRIHGICTPDAYAKNKEVLTAVFRGAVPIVNESDVSDSTSVPGEARDHEGGSMSIVVEILLVVVAVVGIIAWKTLWHRRRLR